MSNANLNRVVLETDTAISAYNKMTERSAEMNEFLKLVDTMFLDVNDQDSKMYVGAKSPAQLRDELDAFSEEFAPVYTEIENFARDIDVVVKTEESH